MLYGLGGDSLEELGGAWRGLEVGGKFLNEYLDASGKGL
jgi:hypothetical protein